MLKYKLNLIILILVFGPLEGFAQSSFSIQSFQEQHQSAFNIRSKAAAEFARKNSMPISQNTLEGRHLLLVGVENGIPIFRSTLNSGAAATTGVIQIQGGMSGFNLEGEGVLIGVWDDGSVKDHIELGGRVVSKEVSDDQTHATHVTGTLISAGINSDAKGMAPKATVTNWYFDNDLAEMAALAKPDENSLLLSNHSYGTVTGWTKVNNVWNWYGNLSISANEDYRFGFYGSEAESLDQLANLAPYYTIVWAAGNDRGEPGDGSRPPDCNEGTGYDCIIPESVAKNIITVGAINKVAAYTDPSSVVMSTFSSWGPTDDGRIKPDVVGAGVSLFSLSADGTDTYGFLSGTSMATPNVAGSLALLQELHAKLHGGKVMKSATLKTLAIHTAKEAGILPGPDYIFGWGLVDAEAGANLLLNEDNVNTIVREELLQNDSVFELTLNPIANQKITATIVWNDPAAQPISAALDPLNLMLVNDLDLRLIAENGSVHYPWLLDPSTPSAQAIKGDNFRDNVERLEFNFPEAKPYSLVVSHKSQLDSGSQYFSLILTYQSSQSTANALYWVGDSGDWGDNAHWSFSSGGAAAFVLPGQGDHVIIDENSFDGSGLDQIVLTQDQSCGTVKWLRSLAATLSLQGNVLSISEEFNIASDSFTTSGTGSIRCTSSPTLEGSIFFTNTDLGAVHLLIDGGEWTMRGSLNGEQLELIQGKLSITKSELELNKLVANSSLAKELIFEGSNIDLIEESDIDGANLVWESEDSKIQFESTTATLNWDDVSYDGSLELIQSNLTINGNNSIEELIVHPGSSLLLESSSNQNINKVSKLEGDAINNVNISSTTKASITLTDHFLLCSDFINITNVDLIGAARINTGLNSTISNSANWLSQPCETVLFADFDEKYLCENGFTEFTDKSLGVVTGWEWDFGDTLSAINSSIIKDPFHGFETAGTYTIQLNVSDGQSTHSYSKQIEITTDSVDKNSIAINANDLVSLATSPSYQWFLNEQKIDGATSRSYAYEGNEGVYRVVIYGGTCNRSSDLVTITGLEAEEKNINVYPNPASEALHIEVNSQLLVRVSLTDVLGKIIFTSELDQDLTIPLHRLNNGIYLLKIEKENTEIIRKILVSH